MPTESDSKNDTTVFDDAGSQLLERFSSSKTCYFSPNEMAIAVDAAKTYAASKGVILNCFVLIGIEDNFSEIEHFLRTLEQNKNDYPNNRRIQYLLGYSPDGSTEILHWTTTDIQISNGKLTFYLLDSAELLDGLLLQILLINTICTNSEVYFTDLKIQKDMENCGNFSLDILTGIKKICGLPEILKSLSDSVLEKNFSITSTVSYGQFILNIIKNGDLYDHDEVGLFYDLLNEEQIAHLTKSLHKLKHIPRDLLLKHPSFGSIFKNNQDKTLATDGVICRSRKKTLTEFISENQGNYTRNGQVKYGNLAIIKKAEKINKRSAAHLKSSKQQYGTILANRQGINFLIKPTPKAPDHAMTAGIKPVISKKQHDVFFKAVADETVDPLKLINDNEGIKKRQKIADTNKNEAEKDQNTKFTCT